MRGALYERQVLLAGREALLPTLLRDYNQERALIHDLELGRSVER